jgi:hypothetical protein
MNRNWLIGGGILFGPRVSVDPDCPRDPSSVRIEPMEGAIVKELFNRYLRQKDGLLGLAKHLLELGLPLPRGNPR